MAVTDALVWGATAAVVGLSVALISASAYGVVVDQRQRKRLRAVEDAIDLLGPVEPSDEFYWDLNLVQGLVTYGTLRTRVGVEAPSPQTYRPDELDLGYAEVFSLRRQIGAIPPRLLLRSERHEDIIRFVAAFERGKNEARRIVESGKA